MNMLDSLIPKSIIITLATAISILFFGCQAQAQGMGSAYAPEILGPGISVDALSTSTSILLSNPTAQKSRYGDYARALILEAEPQIIKDGNQAKQVTVYKLEILSGPHKNTKQISVMDPSQMNFGFSPQMGDMVIIYIQPDSNQDELTIFLENHDRRNIYLWLALTVFVLLLLLAGARGLRIFLFFLTPIILLLELVIPLYTHKYPALLIIFLTALVYSATHSLLFQGYNRKTAATILTTVTSSTLSYILIRLLSDWANLNIYTQNPAIELFKENPSLDIQFMVVLGMMMIFIGTVHAITSPIMSAVHGLKKANLILSFKKIFSTSMNIGKEYLVSSAPVISLAYLGLSFVFFLNTSISQNPFIKNINDDAVSQALILPIGGLMGLILSIFIASIVAALFWTEYTPRQLDPLKRAVSWRQNDEPPGDPRDVNQ